MATTDQTPTAPRTADETMAGTTHDTAPRDADETRSPPTDGDFTLPCGGIVTFCNRRPVLVCDGATDTGCDCGEIEHHYNGATEEQILRDLEGLGWRVTFGEWSSAEGEPDCVAEVTDAAETRTAGLDR